MSAINSLSDEYDRVFREHTHISQEINGKHLNTVILT